MRRVLVSALFFLVFCNSASALDFSGGKSSIFLFGGVFRDGTFPGWTMIPFTGGVEHNYLAGAALNTDYLSYDGLRVGVEIGAAGRFGEGSPASLEVWTGPSIHYDLTVGSVTITPGLVFGFSAVTNSIGIEHDREVGDSGNATFLFYLGPELAFRFASMPNVTFVMRTQHRSGGEGTLGNMAEGTNANTFGVRFNF